MKDAILIVENLDLHSLLMILQKEYDFYYDEAYSLYHKRSSSDDTRFISFLKGKHDISLSYEGEDREHVYSVLSNPVFFYVEFIDFSFFKEIMLFISKDAKIIVDNDHGHFFEKEQLSELEEWIW